MASHAATKYMKRLISIIAVIICAFFASIYIYPIFKGLILLPLDLLVSNSSPWHLAGQILLKNPYMQDSVLQMYPWEHLSFVSLTHGIIPLWNPYQFMGLPFMASMKPTVFYPADIFYILGEVKSWNLLLWSQLFLSLWFTYLLVESLGAGPLASLFAGVAFAFNSLMVSVLEFGSEGHVLLWLPAILYFAKRFLETEKRWFAAGVALSVASSILAGQLQYFAYLSALAVAFIIFYARIQHVPKKSLFTLFGAYMVGGLITGVQLLPGLDMFRESYRGIAANYTVFAGGLIKPFQLLRLLSPDWFGNPVSLDLHGGYIEFSGYFGLIPLFFATYAAIADWKNKFVRFFAIAGFFSLLFSMNGIAQIIYFLRIPIISSGYGSRLFSMFLFSGAALSGLGLKRFIDSGSAKRWKAVTVFACAVFSCYAVGVVVGHWNRDIGVSFTNIKIQIIVLIAFVGASFGYVRYEKKVPLSGYLFALLVIALTFGELFRMGYRFLTFSNEKFLYPETPTTQFVRQYTKGTLDRVQGITEPEVNTELGIPGIETYDPLFPLRTATLLQALEDRRGMPLHNNKYYLVATPHMKVALDMLGAKLIVVPKGTNPAYSWWNSQYEASITKIFSDDKNDVYENLTAHPRFGLFYDVRQGLPDETILDALAYQSVDFQKTILLSEMLPASVETGTGSATLVSSGLNTLAFSVTTSTPSLFYLSDSYDSGWHASVNGKETPIYHANYNFRAILVPKGTSSVRFWYLPKSVIIGSVLSGGGILLLIAYISLPWFAKRKSEEVEERYDKSHTPQSKSGVK